MNGQLSEQPLAELIREITTTGLSGALRLVRERVQAVIYTQAGALIYARSNLRAHRLVECLRRWEFLTAEQLGAFGHAAMSEAEVCTALVNAGALKQSELPGLRLRQAADVLRPLLLWTDGEWTFDPRARLAEETEVAGTIAVDELLLEGARRLPPAFAAARLTEEDVLAPAAAPPTHLSLLPAEAFILSRVDAPLTLAELVAVSGLPEADTRHTAYALALAGLLTRASWPIIFDAQTLAAQARATEQTPASAAAGQSKSSPTTAKPQAQVPPPAPEATPAPEADPQAEMAALLARARSADYYEVLGVARHAEAGEIKRAYYALAKRFHPDRFRRVADEAQRGRVEAAFARIAQAYETLTDDRARAAYDAKLPPEQSPLRPAARVHQEAVATSATPAARADAPAGKVSAEESFQQGLAALKQDNYRTAALCLAEAVRLAPKQARYRAYYGRALTHDPRTRRQAEAELRTALELDAANANYHVMLAELYQTLGQPRRAESELRRALALEPRHAAAQQLLDKQKKQ